MSKKTAKHNTTPPSKAKSFFVRERLFIGMIGIFLIIAGSTYQMPDIARWVGFFFAGYAAIANDSIQTIGTFIASNKHRPWWLLWCFIGGVFLVTMFISWTNYGGPVDVSLKNLPKNSEQPILLRIELKQEGSKEPVFREMFFDHRETERNSRESLGFDISISHTVQSVSLGTLGKNICFVQGKWVSKPEDIDKETQKNLCWNGYSLPTGALVPPPMINVYARGQDTGNKSWELRDGEQRFGSIHIDPHKGGDVSSQRLFAKGFDMTPSSFSFLQVAAPIFLLILTRFKMPVSTTFLLLTSFATEAKSIAKVLEKSFTGYFLAFVIAMIVWLTLSPQFKKWFTGKAHPLWTIAQWCTTGILWSVWLMQDAANIAVYLPRQLNFIEFLGFALPVFFGLGLMFKMGGERIQQIVDEKSQVVDVRAATIIDFIYAIILFYFKMHSKIPMSTTWVFLGLIGGRELAMNIRKSGDRTVKSAALMMARDTGAALLGLLVSLIIAMACNEAMYDGIMASFGL